MTAKELSEWFYYKSCYYHGVEKLNRFSPSYIRAWFRFMFFSLKDEWRKPHPDTKGKE